MEKRLQKLQQFSDIRKKPRWPGDRMPKDPEVPRKDTNPKDEQDKLPSKKEEINK